MPEGKTTVNGLSSWDYKLQDIGIFSFDGEVFFGRGADSAIHKKADRDLQLTNPETTKLIKKQQEIYEGLSDKKTFSKEEEEKLRQDRTKKADRLLKQYYERYPKKTTTELKPKVLSQPLTQGDPIIQEVNWSTDSNYPFFYRWIMPRLS